MIRKAILGLSLVVLASAAHGAVFTTLLEDGFSDGNALTAGGQTIWDQFNPSGNYLYDSTGEAKDVDDIGWALNIKGHMNAGGVYNQCGGIVSKQAFTLSQDTLRLSAAIKNITADNSNAKGDLYVSLMSSNTAVTASDLMIRIDGWSNSGVHGLTVSANGATLGTGAHNQAVFSNVVLDLDATDYTLYIDDMTTPVAQGAHGMVDTEDLYLGVYFKQTSWNYYYWLNGNVNGGYVDSVTVSQVPEPATVGLLSLGGAMVSLRRRRRK